MRILDIGSTTELDATFSIIARESQFELHFESRGPRRNTEYERGLRVLLERLGKWAAVLEGVWVASRDTDRLSRDERLVVPDSFAYPLRLDTTDANGLRLGLGRAMALVGRSPGATGRGNATKRLELQVRIPSREGLSAAELSDHVAGGAVGSSYWVLVARPETYRIAEAVHAKEYDLWKTGGRPIALGDRVIIWKATGNEAQRGVVALGRVVEGPRLGTDRGNPFWVDPAEGTAAVERVLVRYDVPRGLPLWLGAPEAGVLTNLAVTRATGGSVFEVTSAEWAAVARAAKAWRDAGPIEDTGRVGRGQGRMQDPRVRSAIEQHAVARATAYFEGLNWSVENVGTRASFDLLCRRDREILHVEVKGTTQAGESIILPINEVVHARYMFPRVALFITSGISVEQAADGVLRASGGTDTVLNPWRIEDGHLEPTAFVWRPRDTEGTASSENER